MGTSWTSATSVIQHQSIRSTWRCMWIVKTDVLADKRQRGKHQSSKIILSRCPGNGRGHHHHLVQGMVEASTWMHRRSFHLFSWGHHTFIWLREGTAKHSTWKLRHLFELDTTMHWFHTLSWPGGRFKWFSMTLDGRFDFSFSFYNYSSNISMMVTIRTDSEWFLSW